MFEVRSQFFYVRAAEVVRWALKDVKQRVEYLLPENQNNNVKGEPF